MEGGEGGIIDLLTVVFRVVFQVHITIFMDKCIGGLAALCRGDICCIAILSDSGFFSHSIFILFQALFFGFVCFDQLQVPVQAILGDVFLAWSNVHFFNPGDVGKSLGGVPLDERCLAPKTFP